jgi:hypothetical protein
MEDCLLVHSCCTRDLLLYKNQTVRFLRYDNEQKMIYFTYDPCQCTSCVVGHTRHGTNTIGTSELSEVYFPKYNYLHHWDQTSPVTYLFRKRSEQRVDYMVARKIIYGPTGLWHF